MPAGIDRPLVTRESRWHTQSAAEVFAAFRTGERGLNLHEVKRRLDQYGYNKLPEARTENVAGIFFRQFHSPLIYVLLAAGGLVFALGETADALIIMAVLVFNAAVGTVQEGRAQNTLRSLKQFVETTATVVRDGREIVIADIQVVPGDIIVLRSGEKVPADARLFLSYNLTVDEAAFTGESEPVHKLSEPLADKELPFTEQRNMVFKGTHVVAGTGRAVVVAAGPATAIGAISQEIAAVDTEIPLKADIRRLSHFIIITVAGVNAVLLAIGVLRGYTLKEMFTTVVALSVSIIPEGLPIVMTLVLATGVWRMAKRQVLVKKLQAVEALGQARVIALDKTGTLTRNELVVQKIYVNGKFFEGGKIVDLRQHPELLMAARSAALCSSAQLTFNPATKEWRSSGDPTEAALMVFARTLGLRREELEETTPLLFELPFDYTTKLHITVHRSQGRNLVTVTGAPEVILAETRSVWRPEGATELTEAERARLEAIFTKLSQEGLRVVACAVSSDHLELPLRPHLIRELTLVGFYAMKDALREGAASAVQQVRRAGLRVVMITGDHRLTAEAVAREAGIYRRGDVVLTGREVETFSETELAHRLGNVSVFARVTPEHKLKIIQAYRSRGEIVAMTGDGVNDAPSLVAADLGIAIGRIGTEVAKEAADIILLDDNFKNITAAIEEGRSIYRTTQKVILYLFSTSLGELLTISGALLIGLPLPVLPVQIVWLNFVTDGFLDVALAMEPKERGLLRARVGQHSNSLIDRLLVRRMFIMALPMMIGTLALFAVYAPLDPARAWTVSLTVLAVFQWFNAWNCRSEEKSVFRMGWSTNRYLIAATVTIITLQLLALYLPLLQRLLHTTPLTVLEWLVIVAVASSIVVVEETRKFMQRR